MAQFSNDSSHGDDTDVVDHDGGTKDVDFGNGRTDKLLRAVSLAMLFVMLIKL